VKKYATGKGGAKKEQVALEAVRRFPDVKIADNDQADALWMAAMGCDWLGWPIVTVPLANRAVLESIRTWPLRSSITKFPGPDPARMRAVR
jgi:hypothetical protein